MWSPASAGATSCGTQPLSNLHTPHWSPVRMRQRSFRHYSQSGSAIPPGVFCHRTAFPNICSSQMSPYPQQRLLAHGSQVLSIGGVVSSIMRRRQLSTPLAFGHKLCVIVLGACPHARAARRSFARLSFDIECPPFSLQRCRHVLSESILFRHEYEGNRFEVWEGGEGDLEKT